MSARTAWETAVSEILAELAAAATAVSLYGAAHPRVKESLGRLAVGVHAHLAEHETLALVLVGEELFVNQRSFNRLARQAPSLMRRLRRHGAGYVTITAGVEEGELAALVAGLAAADDIPLASSAHIEVGSVTVAEASAEGGASEDLPGAGGRRLPTIRDRVAVVAESLDAFARGRPLPTGELEHVVQAVLQALTNRPHPASHLAPWEGEGRWLAVHAHNTCVLATALARLAGIGRAAAAEVGLAALLHDIGKAFLAEEYVAGEENLPVGDELELILDHPKDGLRFLLPITHLPPVVLLVVAEHHLHYRGTGFPPLPRPRRPHPASCLVAVCEAVDTLLTRFASRGRLTREGALAWLTQHAGTILDPAWAGAAIQLFAPQPEDGIPTSLHSGT